MPAWHRNTSAGYLSYRSQAIARGEVAAPGRLGAAEA
jgi:hypothetical protein